MKISQEVLEVLSCAETVGSSLILTGQLDRKLYEQTNKIIVACGGKWNRAKKAHLFPGEARDHLETVLTTGEITKEKGIGFFPTPDPLAVDLVKLADVQHGHHVLEPSAGTGNLVRAIQDAGGVVTACEYDPGRRNILLRDVLKSQDELVDTHDFLDFKHVGRVDRVVMNPPFTKVGRGDHLDHVRHAYSMLKPGGVLVSIMPSSIEFRRDARYVAFRAWMTGGTIERLPEGSFKASGTGVNTCVIRVTR